MSANRITTTVELTRESFDPLFTSEFFNAPQQTEIPKPLPFPLPPGNTASEFANKLDKFINSNMEVHYVKSFTFQYAQLLGLKQDSYDVYFDNLNPEKSEKLFEGIIKKLPKALTLDNMIPHLIAPFDLDAIVHDLKNYLSELQKDTDNKDSIPLLLTSYYESKINALKDELDQYGMDEDWVTGTLIDIDFAEDSITITLDPDAIKTLEITLINRLFAREILNPNHRIAIEFAFGRTDVLHLIAGKNNVDLAYVKVSNNGEKYTPFFNYYNALTPEKKKTVNETLGRQYTLANDQQKLGITKLMDHELIFSYFLENKIVDPTAILRIEFLIRNGATPTPEIQKLLLNIAENDSALYLKWLQENIILPTWKNEKGLTPIVFAATHGKTELVAFLIDHCKSTDNNGVSPLALAVYGRHIETIEFLIAKGAKTTQDIQESLFFMVK